MKVHGKMTNLMVIYIFIHQDTVSIDLIMVPFLKEDLLMDNLMDKELYSIIINIMIIVNISIIRIRMISNNIMAYGKIHYHMDMDKHYIIMEIFIKDHFLMGKDKDLGHISLIKYINIKGNGKIIFLMVKAKYIEMNNYFLKDNFKMV